MQSVLASLLVPLVIAQSLPNITQYYPSNQTDTNLNLTLTTLGAPGIYDSSSTPDNEYGIYNWCDMPHVRRQEYIVPPSNYTLRYVDVTQRHHKRTPYGSNTFFLEDFSWNCTDQGPDAGSKSSVNLNATQFNTTRTYWQALTGTVNPFEYTVGPGFPNSTCQLPQLTAQGLDDALQHGQDFAGVYSGLLNFLPTCAEKDRYEFRVTNNVITSQTMSGEIKGIYPDIEEHIALVQSSAYDSLEPLFSCPLADTITDLRQRFNNVSGIQSNDTAGWNSSWDHPAKQCHGYPLPCSVNNTALCVSQADADEVYRLGNWEWAYYWRAGPNATLASVLTMGPFMLEVMHHLNETMANTSSVIYRHNFAEDGSMGPLLGILQTDAPVWPGMGSEVVFELWEAANQFFMRVLWNGQPLVTSTPLGTLDMIPIQNFTSYLNSVIPDNLVELCNLS